MFVQFSVVRAYLSEKIIPALLLEYAVEKPEDLSSPLRGDLLFIKALLDLLDSSPQATHILAGALLTLSALHPKCTIGLPGHLVPKQSHEVKPVGFAAAQKRERSTTSEIDDEFNVSSFLFFMFQHLMQQTGPMLNRNAEVLRWWRKALELRTSFLRTQGYHALLSSPGVTLKAASPFLDLGAVDVFVKHFMSRDSVVQHPVIISAQEAGFVQRALGYLEQAQWPLLMKKAAIQGVSMLENSFSSADNPAKFNAMRRWEAYYAVSVLCKVHLFEQGQAKLGPALVPLFGLSDVDVIRYWNKALALAESALMTLVQERLHSEIKLYGPHSFFEITPSRRGKLESVTALHP